METESDVRLRSEDREPGIVESGDQFAMRICHLRASNFYGGPERQIHNHAIAARRSGFVVTVASFSERGRSPGFLDVVAKDGISTIIVPVSSSYDFRSIHLLRDALIQGRFDLLATHDYRSHTVGWRAAAGVCRWIAFSRGFTHENLKVRILQSIGQRIAGRAYVIVAVSFAQRDRLIRCGVSPERIQVAQNAVDTEAMESVLPVDLRARFGFSGQTFIIVSAGRFSREKGQVDLVSAAQRVIQQEPSARFVLFGDGPDRAKMKVELVRRGLASHVLCPGFEPNTLGCMRGADLIVNPSLSEGLPNVLLEAMALGVPVVATAVGGVPELISDGESGRLVPARRPDLLAAALIELLRDPPMRDRFSTSARSRVHHHFSFAMQMRELETIYRSVAVVA